jgi:hypothetical protein
MHNASPRKRHGSGAKFDDGNAALYAACECPVRWLVGHVPLWTRILSRGPRRWLRELNQIDAGLARLMHRPMTSGHLGERIAARVFDIELEASAVAAGIDAVSLAAEQHDSR